MRRRLLHELRGRGRRFLEIAGERLSVSEWSRKSGIAVGTIYKRLAAGWTPEAAVVRPTRTRAFGGSKAFECGRCGARGHNVRTCAAAEGQDKSTTKR